MIQIPIWKMFQHAHFDSMGFVTLTERQVMSLDPLYNKNGTMMFRLYRIECTCRHIGRTRSFLDAQADMIEHNKLTSHTMISIRAGTFPLSQLGELNK